MYEITAVALEMFISYDCNWWQALGKLCGGKDDWPGTLALVHSYLTHKAGKLS